MTFDIKAAKARAEAKRAEAPIIHSEEPDVMVQLVEKTPEEIQAQIEQAAIEKEAHDRKVLAFKIEQGLKSHKALPEDITLGHRNFANTAKTQSAINLYGALTGSSRYNKGNLSSSVSIDVERMIALRLKAITDPVLQAYLDSTDAEFRRTID